MGADIISFHLQYRDSVLNKWVDVIGEEDKYNLVTQWSFVTSRGTTYEVRYRVRNSVGWSGFSPIS